MGFSDVWNRTLVYFGIAEDDDWDEDGLATEEELARDYRRDRHNVRKLPRSHDTDDWSDGEEKDRGPAAATPARRRFRPACECSSGPHRAASTTPSRSRTSSRARSR